jgi:transcriptional regulator with XRE-family HTH domain
MVAERLRLERGRRKMSLSALSTSSGVSRSMLSQIESGKTTPTITVLWKIATALEMPFSALLGDDRPPAAVIVRRGGARTVRSADGGVVSRPLFLPSRERRVELYELTLEPRAEVRSPAHAGGTKELLVVTRGRLRIEVGGDAHELAAGDAIEFQADVPHAYVNPGPRPCVAHDIIVYP